MGASLARATEAELPKPKVTLSDANNVKRVLDEYVVKVRPFIRTTGGGRAAAQHRAAQLYTHAGREPPLTPAGERAGCASLRSAARTTDAVNPPPPSRPRPVL